MAEDRMRVIYLDKGDLAFGYEAQEALKLLESSLIEGRFSPTTINDAIELHECWRLYHEIMSAMVKDKEWYNRFGRLATPAKSAALAFILRYIQEKPLVEIVEETDPQLYSGLFHILMFKNISNNIKENDLEAVLEDKPYLIDLVLSYKPLVQQFDRAVKGAMLSNKVLAAELIVRAKALDGERGGYRSLPCVTNQDVVSIFDAYCDSREPHPNILQIISNWSNDYGFSLTPELKYKAAQRAEELRRTLFDNPERLVFHQDSSIDMKIDPEQITCLRARVNLPDVSYSFSGKWLEATLGEADILTNLIYVFGFIDSWGLINIARPDHSMSTLIKTLTLSGKSDYRFGFQFKISTTSLFGMLKVYERFLLQHDKSLEASTNWFFNSYIKTEYGAQGFRSDMPTAEESYLSKCKAISSEIERIAREYDQFSRNGEIDDGLFRFEQFPNFEGVHSLLVRKYAYGCGEDYRRATFLLFSDQCMLAFLRERGSKASSFCKLISNEVISRECYDQHYLKKELDWLIEQGFVSVDEDGKLILAARGRIVHLLWSDGTVPFWRCSKAEQAMLLKAGQDGLVEFESTLLSRSEADVFNYFLTDRKFSNSLGIRNKYAHGAPLVDDPNAEEFQQDYLVLLAFCMLLVLKINDDLSLAKGKIWQLELVDWPWFEVA